MHLRVLFISTLVCMRYYKCSTCSTQTNKKWWDKSYILVFKIWVRRKCQNQWLLNCTECCKGAFTSQMAIMLENSLANWSLSLSVKTHSLKDRDSNNFWLAAAAHNVTWLFTLRCTIKNTKNMAEKARYLATCMQLLKAQP